MPRKLSRDENAQTSTGFKVVILIIIGLVFWEFGGVYLGFNPLSSYLGYTEETPEDVSFTVAINNNILGYLSSTQPLLQIDPDPINEHETIPVYRLARPGWIFADHDYDYDEHTLEMVTNAPVRSYLPYTIKVTTIQVDHWHSVTETTVLDIDIVSPMSEGDKAIDWEYDGNFIRIDDFFLQYTVIKATLYDPFGSVVDSYEFAVIDEDLF